MTSMFPVSVKGVLRTPSGELVLLLNERDEWELPGGRIEVGETPKECVEREIREELGLTVVAEELLDTCLFEVIPGKHVFIVSYGCRLTSAFLPLISDEHKQIATFAPDKLPSKLPLAYRAAIAAWTCRSRAVLAGPA